MPPRKKPDPLDHDADGKKGGDAAARKPTASASPLWEEVDTPQGRQFSIQLGDNTFYELVSHADLADPEKDAAAKARARLVARTTDR